MLSKIVRNKKFITFLLIAVTVMALIGTVINWTSWWGVFYCGAAGVFIGLLGSHLFPVKDDE